MTPIELYKIIDGGITYLYTSTDRDVEYEGETYLSIPIKRTAIEAKGSVKRENIEVSFAIDNEMAKGFLTSIPENIVSITIFIQSKVGTFVGWKGRMAAVKPERGEIKLIFESIFTSLVRSGLRQPYQRGCRHMLYSTRCGVDRDAHVVTVHANAMNGYVVTLSAVPSGEDGLYTGGVMSYNGGLRGIIIHDGANLTVNDFWPGLRKAIADSGGAGVDIQIYPGCDRTTETCTNRFGNFPNYGGFPYIPTRNPFNGSPIT